MKKIFILSLITLTTIVLTGCGNTSSGGKESGSDTTKDYDKYTYYELHMFDVYDNVIASGVARYDKSGNLVDISEETLYIDKTDKNACDNLLRGMVEDEETKVTCKTTSEGTKITMTVKKPLIETDSDPNIKLLKESTAKEYFNDYLEQLKKRFEHSDKNTYMVIANKKVEW